MILGLTYRDPDNNFGPELIQALKSFRPEGIEKIYVQVSRDTRNEKTFFDLKELEKESSKIGSKPPHVEVATDIRSDWSPEIAHRNRGAATDFELFIKKLPLEDGIYCDGDTFAMTMLLWPKELRGFWQEARHKLKKEEVGVVELERTERAMSTYPPWQIWSEALINNAFRIYFPLECRDITSGVFAYKAEVLEKWREIPNYGRTRGKYYLTLAKGAPKRKEGKSS